MNKMALVVVAVVMLAGMVVGEPITECEVNGQEIADRDSCTRFHTCVPAEDGKFNTHISICEPGFLYDLVTSTCIKQETGYVQDPESCETFFGCHEPTTGGEGLIRRHYRCPGELRFHPKQKMCTYKVFVSDDLCTNTNPEDVIIGTRPATPATTTTTTTTTTASTTTTDPPTTTTPNTTPEPTTPTTTITTTIPDTSTSTTTTTTAPTTTTATTPVRGGEEPVRRVGGGGASRPDVSDLARITSVIKAQLLQRSKVAAPSPFMDGQD
ncbi:integumentary mucin C.1-like [Eriocheir sinensis]|uniref:integumentary mucin C.1-like n=1 Tax=Eriocheir sinensis TaxID=95602 RepID=UPI0021C9D47C|nr:integumentary mucin C.1-like [Eriocheir sinensis]